MVLISDTDRLSLALAPAELGDWSWDPVGELLHRDDAARARIAVERALATTAQQEATAALAAQQRWFEVTLDSIA